MEPLVLDAVDPGIESSAARPEVTMGVDDWDVAPAVEPAPPAVPAAASESAPVAASAPGPNESRGDPSAPMSAEQSPADNPPKDPTTDVVAEPTVSAATRGKDDQMASIKQPVQEKRTIVEEGTKLKGDLESACPVVVNGRVEGSVQAPSLTVSATGVVEGTARVGTIHCEGELAGEFDADHIELSGTVKDNTVIRAATIEMKITGKRGKKQLIFGDVEEADQPVVASDSAASEVPTEEASAEASEPRPSQSPPAAPVNGRPSQPPPP